MSLIWRANWQEKRLSQFGVKMPVYVNKGSLKHYHTSDECSLSTTKLSTSGFVDEISLIAALRKRDGESRVKVALVKSKEWR